VSLALLAGCGPGDDIVPESISKFLGTYNLACESANTTFQINISVPTTAGVDKSVILDIDHDLGCGFDGNPTDELKSIVEVKIEDTCNAYFQNTQDTQLENLVCSLLAGAAALNIKDILMMHPPTDSITVSKKRILGNKWVNTMNGYKLAGLLNNPINPSTGEYAL